MNKKINTKLYKALDRAEKRFQAICEITSDWIWEVDENGLYTYSNPKVKDILGYGPEEIIGKTPFEFMPKDEAEKISKYFQKLKTEKKSFSGLININLHKMGKEIVLETGGVPLFDSDGSFKGFRGIDRDITRRKQLEDELLKARDELAQKVEERTRELKIANQNLKAQIKKHEQTSDKLRESEKRFRMLVESMNEGLAIQDSQGKVLYVNNKILKITGYNKKEMIGKNVTDFLDTTNKAIYQKQSLMREQKIAESYEIKWTAKDGSKIATIVSPKIIFGRSGEYEGTFAVITDIRSLMRTQSELKKSKKKLKQRAERLKEVNTALRVLLQEREKDKRTVEKRLLSNIRQLIWPYLYKLDDTRLKHSQKCLLDILKSNLEELQSTYVSKLSTEFTKFTQTELKVVNLIKLGKSTQEIADTLGTSYKTAETHRFRIRKKLGLNNKGTNLRTYLSILE